MLSKWCVFFVLADVLHPSLASASVANNDLPFGSGQCATGLSSANRSDIEGSSCIVKKENLADGESITEATPPLNYTVPAPRLAEGLGSDMGEPQDMDPSYSNLIFERVERARDYINSKVMVEDIYKEIRPLCVNKHSSCAFWSVLGECDNNPAYMHIECAPVCETCEVRHLHVVLQLFSVKRHSP